MVNINKNIRYAAKIATRSILRGGLATVMLYIMSSCIFQTNDIDITKQPIPISTDYDPTLTLTPFQVTATPSHEPANTAEPSKTNIPGAPMDASIFTPTSEIDLDPLIWFNYGGKGHTIWEYDNGDHFIKIRGERFNCKPVVFDVETMPNDQLPNVPKEEEEPNAMLCTSGYFSSGDWIVKLYKGELTAEEVKLIGELVFKVSAPPTQSPFTGNNEGKPTQKHPFIPPPPTELVP